MKQFENIKNNSIFNENPNLIILNCLDVSSMLSDKNKDIFSYLSINLEKEKMKSSNIFIIGLDLLEISKIRQFFSFNSKILYNFNFVSYLFSIDNSSKNLNSFVETKKLYIQKQLNLFGSERNKQIIQKTNKLISLFELNNFTKLTKETMVFEFNFINNETLPTFEKISLYTKEYKDIFEQVKQDEKKAEV